MPYTPTTWNVNDLITDTKMNKIENGIVAVEQNANTLIGGVNTSIGTINQSIQTINGSINDINTDITSIQQSIAGLDVSSINDSITQLTSAVGSINTSIETIDTNLETIEGSIEDLEDEIEELQELKIYEPETFYEELRIDIGTGTERYLRSPTPCILTDLTWQEIGSYDYIKYNLSYSGSSETIYISPIYIIPSYTLHSLEVQDRVEEGYYLEDSAKTGFLIFGAYEFMACLPTDTNIAYYDPNES